MKHSTHVRTAAAAIIVTALLLIPVHAIAARGRVAVVVHRANALNGLSSAELRRILLGDETRWGGKERITILLLPPGTEERRAVLKSLLKMSDDDFMRHWISRVFQGEATVGPKVAASPESMLRLVAGLPSALAIVDADDVPAGGSGLKILRVDGKAPGDEGYPFVSSPSGR